ncbi:hypothetical protein ACGF3K_33445 [Streptomyces sp. NPDC047980]|uniref:hypothetical protein n=1 Tax=Streptomyces sp. NPDC047980 TaxID=3365494 RepID=UPI003723E40A
MSKTIQGRARRRQADGSNVEILLADGFAGPGTQKRSPVDRVRLQRHEVDRERRRLPHSRQIGRPVPTLRG